MGLADFILGLVFYYFVDDLDSIKNVRLVSKKWERYMNSKVKSMHRDEQKNFNLKVNALFRLFKRMEIYDYIRIGYSVNLGPWTPLEIDIYWNNSKWSIYYSAYGVMGHQTPERRKFDEIVQYLKERASDDFLDVQIILRKLIYCNNCVCKFNATIPHEAKKEFTTFENPVNLIGSIIVDFSIYDIGEKAALGSYCVQNIFKKSECTFLEIPEDIKHEILSFLVTDLEGLKIARLLCMEWRDFVDKKTHELYLPFYNKFQKNTKLLFGLIKEPRPRFGLALVYIVKIDSVYSIRINIEKTFQTHGWLLVIGVDCTCNKYNDINPYLRSKLDKIYEECGIKNSLDCISQAYNEMYVDISIFVTDEDMVRILHKMFLINNMRTRINIKYYDESIKKSSKYLNLLEESVNVLSNNYCDNTLVQLDLSFSDYCLCKIGDTFYMPHLLSKIIKRKLDEPQKRNVKPRLE